jgi:glycine/D-amino acid oxidase-like deaminating enzyme
MRVIIVGGGLAGICIAHHLEKKGVSFTIFDEEQNVSTKVAAGMINPMSFRRMLKSWNADVLIPYLNSFYPAIEKKVEGRFFYHHNIRRVFSTEEERQLWEERLADPDFKEYLNPIDDKAETPAYIKNRFGCGFVNAPGYIEAKDFMAYNHSYFRQQNKLEYEPFDFEKLDVTNDTYKGEAFTHLVFAEGFRGIFNPYFDYLPLQRAKGEVLTIDSKQIQRDEILNRKCFVLPTIDGNFKIGSTFEWNTSDPSPSEKAKEDLLEKYDYLSSAPIEIVRHEGGIRPTVTDRKPLLGGHPKYPQLYIFNGLGAKGFMVAPYYANQLVDFMLGESKLDSEVDIKRSKKKYEGS